MSDKPRILFLCTANACRSQMAEALFRHLAGDRYEVFSAGSHPAGFIHPLAVEVMRRMNVFMEGHRSKGWEEFEDIEVHAVITLCDDAAGETCPVWPGHPLTAHWPLPDPVWRSGTDEERVAFAMQVAARLQKKLEGLAAMDWSRPRDEQKKRLDALGEI